MIAVDGAPVADVGDLQRLMTGDRVGRPTEISVFRGGRLESLIVTPTELTD